MQAESQIVARSVGCPRLNGHPWLFGLKDMPGEKVGHLPGEGYLRRIDEDGRGWQDLFKLPHIQRLIDVTLRDERTTIVMGDLNVHWDHYANMNKMFNEFGFTDAYAAVHGVDMQDSWTADLCDNTLTQVFGQKSGSSGMLDRERNEYFYNAAYGALCLQRDCPVCEATAGEDRPGPRQD